MKKKKTKAETAEEKGDKAYAKKKYARALGHYRKAQKSNPGNAAIYEKLVNAHRQKPGEWTEADFAESLEWTMKKQELENPSLKKVHERLDPDKAKAALLEILLTLKKSMKK